MTALNLMAANMVDGNLSQTTYGIFGLSDLLCSVNILVS